MCVTQGTVEGEEKASMGARGSLLVGLKTDPRLLLRGQSARGRIPLAYTPGTMSGTPSQHLVQNLEPNSEVRSPQIDGESTTVLTVPARRVVCTA